MGLENRAWFKKCICERGVTIFEAHSGSCPLKTRNGGEGCYCALGVLISVGLIPLRLVMDTYQSKVGDISVMSYKDKIKIKVL